MAQELTAAGEIRWNKGDKSSFIASSKWIEKLGTIVADGVGGVICIFNGEGPAGGKFEGDLDVSAMRISPSGAMMWNNGERAAELGDSDQLERNPSAVVVATK
jgi:hypothetical protein